MPALAGLKFLIWAFSVIKRSAAVPIEIPTLQEVERAFSEALRQAAGSAQTFDDNQYNKLYRGVMSPNWASAGAGVEVLQAANARLFRVHWSFTIDRIDTNLLTALRSQADSLRQTLESAFDGEPVSFDVEKTNVKNLGGVDRVDCAARGIVG